MDQKSRVLGLIGIATKAGKVTFGTEAVLEAIEKRKAKLVIIADDASEKSKGNMIFSCNKKDIPITVFGLIEDISHCIGRKNKSVICINDKNLGEEIYKIICGGEAIG